MKSTPASEHVLQSHGSLSEIVIERLHHAAYRCRDSEQTRAFYEDFLGLPLVGALEIRTTKTGRDAEVLHTPRR